MGVFTLNSVSLMPVPQGYWSGTRGARCGYPCHLHLVVLSISGAEFRLAERGCQLRHPLNLSVTFDRWTFFEGATQSDLPTVGSLTVIILAFWLHIVIRTINHTKGAGL